MTVSTNLPPLRHRPAPASATRPLDLGALTGPAGWARLPPAVRRRFAAGHADTDYVGEMTLRCTRVGRVYAWLAGAFGGPLTGLNATAVPATVRVRDDGRGGVVWDRRFHLRGDAAGRTVRSTKERGPDGGLVERTDGGLGMTLDVFEEAGTLVFLSRGFSLMLGRLRLPIPTLLTPGVCRVTHTDLGGGLFRFTLSMRHPVWGETFHQTGVFADPQEST